MGWNQSTKGHSQTHVYWSPISMVYVWKNISLASNLKGLASVSEVLLQTCIHCFSFIRAHHELLPHGYLFNLASTSNQRKAFEMRTSFI